MYFNDDFLHFSLRELQCVSTLISLFDDDLAKRIDNVYSYHRYTLKEHHRKKNQQLFFEHQKLKLDL